ncbi:MAG: RNA-binding protein [Proteobacteria bacterium]|jgi:RNA recognition motif-containing protein|nr:RNA-binding protein [Pseudomonadota bacterium]
MGKKLFVGNLSFSVNDQTLLDTFSQCGNVESAKVITDRDSGRSKGFGFVEFSSEAEAQAAISKFHGAEHEGRAMTVNEAKPMEPRNDRRDSRGPSRGGNRRY